MYRLIILFIIFVSTNPLFAQSNIRPNNYWENTHYINPASTNEEYIGELSLAGRQQMTGYGAGAPSTFFGSATIYNEKKQTQWGINLYQDKIGYTSSHDISLIYSYSIYLKHHNRLHWGISIDYQDKSYDATGIKLSNNSDQILYNHLQNEYMLNANVGIEFSNSGWKTGLSSLNILSPYRKDFHSFNNTFFLYSIYRHRLQNSIFDWGGGGDIIKYSNIWQAELNANIYFKNDRNADIFNIGIIYRSNTDMGFLFGLKISENIHLSYCFDLDISGLSQNTLGTHELMLIYRFTKQTYCHCEGYNL